MNNKQIIEKEYINDLEFKSYIEEIAKDVKFLLYRNYNLDYFSRTGKLDIIFIDKNDMFRNIVTIYKNIPRILAYNDYYKASGRSILGYEYNQDVIYRHLYAFGLKYPIYDKIFGNDINTSIDKLNYIAVSFSENIHTLEDFKSMYKKVYYIDNHDRYIGPMSIDIFSDYGRSNIFDIIKVDISIIQGERKRKEVVSWIKDNKKVLDKKVVDYIKNNHKFKKFGIPVNFLKCTDIVLSKDYRLIYTLELKEIPNNKLLSEEREDAKDDCKC